MPDCTWPADRPVLVAASTPADARLVEDALAELGLSHVLAEDGVEAMQALCRRPSPFAAVVVGERVGRVSGFTLCGLARDAGYALPMLLLTGDDSRWTAERAARLRLAVLAAAPGPEDKWPACSRSPWRPSVHRRRLRVDFVQGGPMPVQRLKEFLDEHQVKYVVISHSRAFTTQEIAAATHIPGKDLAKTVIVEIDGRTAMAVLPGSQKVDLALLRDALGAERVALAKEGAFKDRFPECDLGAMPPFGNLYGMPVYVADSLTEDEEIAFNAGSHDQLVKLAYRDFERLVQPEVMRFAVNA
jgi:Ala-tRNA(Pro) deacylase